MKTAFENPFKPGAGHMPPYLAGRETEKAEFGKLLKQDAILENLILTGLRGVGKTVLLETLKPIAHQEDWLWVGTDLSESATVSETSISVRLLTDLAVITSSIVIGKEESKAAGFTSEMKETERTLNYQALQELWNKTPGLATDKLKNILELVSGLLPTLDKRGIVFAYDEAQNLADHAEKEQYPLSLLLDVFQSIQRKGIRFMLVLTGLPTLFPKLVEARTFTERMFHIVVLDKLNENDSEEAIIKPIEMAEECPIRINDESVQTIFGITQGYPYFIQYVCREAYDVWSQSTEVDETPQPIPVEEIVRKLDSDFFAGRWSRATDRQRDLLGVVSQLENAAEEFTVQEIAAKSKELLERPFSSSHVNQMLASLSVAGLVYKNRWGRYSLAVPLLDQFIRRQLPEMWGKISA